MQARRFLIGLMVGGGLSFFDDEQNQERSDCTQESERFEL
jgi:hypothetical protein